MNWGHKLTIAIAVFVCLLGVLVYKAIHTDFQLVEKEYYKSELRYQQVIDGYHRAHTLSSKVQIQKKDNGIVVQLPQEMKNNAVQGTLWFYCAYDETKDRKFELNLNEDAAQLLEAGAFEPGRYTVKLEWRINDQHYYHEEKISI